VTALAVVRRAPYHADAHLLENPPLDIVEGSEHGDSLVTGNFLPALGQRQGGGAPLIGLPCEQTERGGLWRDEWAVSKRPWSMPPHQPCQQLGEVAPVAWGLEAAVGACPLTSLASNSGKWRQLPGGWKPRNLAASAGPHDPVWTGPHVPSAQLIRS